MENIEMKEKSWFQRHNTFFFVLALVVLVLNLVIWIFVPLKGTLRLETTAMEYSVSDESYAKERKIVIDGLLTQSVIYPDTFVGKFDIIFEEDEPAQDLTVHLTRKDGKWQGHYEDAYGQAITTRVYDIEATKDFEKFTIALLTKYEKQGDTLTAGFDPDNATFIAIGAESRVQALAQYRSFFLK